MRWNQRRYNHGGGGGAEEAESTNQVRKQVPKYIVNGVLILCTLTGTKQLSGEDSVLYRAQVTNILKELPSTI